jgi:hypothetical protein
MTGIQIFQKGIKIEYPLPRREGMMGRGPDPVHPHPSPPIKGEGSVL